MDSLDRRDVDVVLVHTGQHYDRSMSTVFFDELGIRAPDRWLEVGSGTHADQTARVMSALEPVLSELQPDVVVVVGDVNSTKHDLAGLEERLDLRLVTMVLTMAGVGPSGSFECRRRVFGSFLTPLTLEHKFE